MITPQNQASDGQRVQEEEGVHYLKQMRSELLGHVIQGPYPARLSPGVAQTCKGTKELVRAGTGARPALPPGGTFISRITPAFPASAAGSGPGRDLGLRKMGKTESLLQTRVGMELLFFWMSRRGYYHHGPAFSLLGEPPVLRRTPREAGPTASPLPPCRYRSVSSTVSVPTFSAEEGRLAILKTRGMYRCGGRCGAPGLPIVLPGTAQGTWTPAECCHTEGTRRGETFACLQLLPWPPSGGTAGRPLTPGSRPARHGPPAPLPSAPAGGRRVGSSVICKGVPVPTTPTLSKAALGWGEG